MTRVGHGKHATHVTVADDGTSPVGSDEWNANLDQKGILGFTTTSASIAIAGGILTTPDSVCVVTGEGGGVDDIDSISLTDKLEYDLLYLYGQSGYNVTLKHRGQNDILATGEIETVSGDDEVLSATVPTILMRKGSNWYGYGGGGSTVPTTITVADESVDTTCFPLFVDTATGDRAPKTGSNLLFNSNTGILTATEFAGALTGDASGSSATAGIATEITAVANNSTDETVYPTFVDGATGTQGLETDTGLNYNPSTGLLSSVGLTLSGDLTGTDVALSGRLKTDKGADVASATAMTLGADGNAFDITGTTTIVTIPSTNWAAGNLIHLQFDGILVVTHSSATDSILLGDQANMTTAAGDVLSLFFNGTNWVEVSRSSVSSGGGAHTEQDFTVQAGHATDPASGTATLYVKTIDSNNEGLFIKMKKNGSIQFVQVG